MHDALIQALLDPACYPHPVTKITLCETHISWVLLTGEYAYKIKKPVKLSFLDFSTLALRRQYCEEELRLNCRFAPRLYVAVIAITGTPDAPTLGGSGPAIEYAVKLRQFDAADELTQLLLTHHVHCDDLTHFGHALATLHAALPQAHASLDDWQHTAEQNLTDLLQYFSTDQERFSTLEKQLTTLKKQITPLLLARYRSEAVRECHGDLHLGNVVRMYGALIPFDCIEFDAALRNIDVFNDIAFLFMDLEAHARRDLAYCFLNSWLEQSGDYAGLPSLRYYAAHRALVRAKVLALQVRDRAAIELYMREAEQRAQPKLARLIITCGFSGSGKTWLSKQLASTLPAIHMRSDIERKRLAGIEALASSHSPTNAGIYTQRFNTQTYMRLLTCARAALIAGETVIVDAAFLRREERKAFHALAQQQNATFTVLHCIAPTSTLRQRIDARQQAASDASEATVDVLAQQLEYWEPFAASETTYVLACDTTSDTPSAVVDRLSKIVR